MNSYYKIGIIVFGFIILLGAMWFVLFRDTTPGPEKQEPKTFDQILTDLTKDKGNTGSGEVVVVDPGVQPNYDEVNLDPMSPEEAAQLEIRQTAIRFIERWGTYSSQSTLDNIKSLDSSMTEKLRAYSEQYMTQIRNDHPYQDGYYGITTKVATFDMLNIDLSAGSAELHVNTRREETIKNAEPVAFTQDAEIHLKRVSGTWLVDGVFWEDNRK